MIGKVILVLVIVLVALFIDWTDLYEKFNNRKKSSARPTKPAKVKKERKKEKVIENKNDFSFAEEEVAMVPDLEIIVPEEQPFADDVEDSEVASLLEDADVHFRKGEMKAAEQKYLRAAAKDPKCSKAYSRLGVIYLEEGDNWKDAEEAFRQALKFDSQNGFILNNLGLVLYHQDRYADAIRHFEMAVRQDEYNAARHANLGMAYMAMRQYAKAESSFKKALKLAPHELEYKDLLNESVEKKKAHKSMIRR